jgi:transposase
MKMPKAYTITAENTKALRKAMGEKTNNPYYRKLQAVALRGEGKDNNEIGAITGYHPVWVSHLVALYCKEGLSAICSDRRGGGNNRNMTGDEEKTFLSQFEETSKKGQVTTVAEIAAAYDEKTGKTRESNSTVYYLLHKHGWRLVMPRTTHPGKASEVEIEASKKLKPNTKK